MILPIGKRVRIAVENLRKDLTAVTGSPCAPVIVGTAGKSSVISKYADVLRELDGKWEQYVITTDGDSLVIIGSDKRGTIYGIYELSRQLGVSLGIGGPMYLSQDMMRCM